MAREKKDRRSCSLSLQRRTHAEATQKKQHQRWYLLLMTRMMSKMHNSLDLSPWQHILKGCDAAVIMPSLGLTVITTDWPTSEFNIYMSLAMEKSNTQQ